MNPRLHAALLGALLLTTVVSGCSPKKQADAQVGVAQSGAVTPAVAAPAVPVVTAAPYHELNLSSLQERVPVLTYHDVIARREQPGAVWFDCSLEEFETQMKFLHDQGAHVITLEQLRRHLTAGEKLPGNAVVLTFDDSYQGVYDHAAPVLARYGYPYAVFVHTDYVGSQKGRPKMSWDELKTLDRSGLATIGSHSRSHPADMGLLTAAQQDEELRGSKTLLEQRLGHPVPFITYPNGKADPATFERARLAGYTLGFMEEWGPVEQSPGILALNRYIHIQLPRAWAETYGPDALPAGRVLTLAAPTPVRTERVVAAGVRLTLLHGGALSGQLAAGAPFAPADLLRTATNSLRLPITSHAAGGSPLGPYLVQGAAFVPEADPDRLKLVLGRPLLAWNADRLAILPFAPGLMNDERALAALLPGLKGALVAQAWLVQSGQALSAGTILGSGTSDLRRLRQRVFVGVTATGEPLLGVSIGAVGARQLALAAAEAGAQDAVLLF